ncbi:molecular chaperone DnaJ [Parerythrobacter aurantius]|uniref:molecular chaperone DnaJ n=1 Tax=Parerythrobacter aurantius TaxID=3127706 RepID=UPI003245A4EA
MVRFLVIAALLSLLCRWALGKWPWQYLAKGRSTRADAVFRARRLLAVPQNASRSDIIAAHKRLVAMVHPDRGGSNEQVHEANAARDLLLDELPKEVPPQ